MTDLSIIGSSAAISRRKRKLRELWAVTNYYVASPKLQSPIPSFSHSTEPSPTEIYFLKQNDVEK